MAFRRGGIGSERGITMKFLHSSISASVTAESSSKDSRQAREVPVVILRSGFCSLLLPRSSNGANQEYALEVENLPIEK